MTNGTKEKNKQLKMSFGKQEASLLKVFYLT
jgi:hypothetical protein